MSRSTAFSELPPFVGAGNDLVWVVIETPTDSQNKYDYDSDLGAFILDRPIHSSLRYPCDYGFVPGTLAGDGDALDAILLISRPTFPGCVVKVQVVGMMEMADEAGTDEKIICVAASDPRHAHMKNIEDLPENLRRELEHFFVHIKDLESEKWAKVVGFRGRAEAIALIKRSAIDGKRAVGK